MSRSVRSIMAGIAVAASMASPWTLGADAADPRLEEARALLHSVNIEKQLDTVLGAMSQAFARQFAADNAERDNKVLQIVMTEAMNTQKEWALQPGGLLDIAAQVYASEFTLEELKQLRAFHESPLGQRMQEVAPVLVQKVMEASVKSARERVPQLCARVKARLAAEGVAEGSTAKCPAKAS